MSQTENEILFEDQFKRLYFVTETHTQVEFAEFLGIRQSAVSDARRRFSIPSDWLITLLRLKKINPEWILTGKGPRFICFQTKDHEGCDVADTARETAGAEGMLRLLSSRVLAEELLRRITEAEAEKGSR